MSSIINSISSHNSKPTELAAVKQAIVGIPKHLGGASSLSLNGVLYTPTSLVAFLQAFVDLSVSVIAAKAQAHDLLLQEQTSGLAVRVVLQALRSYVVGLYGNGATGILGDFGFAPKKATTPKVAVKALAAAKNRATRAARHTMGKREKLAIKGTVPVPATGGTSTAGNGASPPGAAPAPAAPINAAAPAVAPKAQ
jgi:hypothetical protein